MKSFLWRCLVVMSLCGVAPGQSMSAEPESDSAEQARLDVMKAHAAQIQFQSRTKDFPKSLSDQPLFRYDDPARGYVDGTVWRLGATGRPKAIITTELHPKYGNQRRLVCDYLSLSEEPFIANVFPGLQWSPPNSAVEIRELPDAPHLAESKSQRLFQLKKMSERFHATQAVEGEELDLRLLPRPIDRYQPGEDATDGAIFVFVSGRNPGVVLLIEASETKWRYGVGRLSGPSTLTVKLDERQVWQVAPASYTWDASYTATNFPSEIPGY